MQPFTQSMLGMDRLDRTYHLAQRAVGAGMRIDDDEVRSFTKRILRADLDALTVAAADACVGDDVGHARRPYAAWNPAVLKKMLGLR